jgi:Protein of unknown function (DUF3467)
MSQSNPGGNPPQSNQPTFKLTHSDDYRDNYANSVQVRSSVWDFFLVFGTMSQEIPTEVEIRGFQGIYLSPQQAKAFFNLLGHNLAQYEQTFGTITLEPQFSPQEGPVH